MMLPQVAARLYIVPLARGGKITLSVRGEFSNKVKKGGVQNYFEHPFFVYVYLIFEKVFAIPPTRLH